jgi:hypothetical protein
VYRLLLKDGVETGPFADLLLEPVDGDCKFVAGCRVSALFLRPPYTRETLAASHPGTLRTRISTALLTVE